MNNLTRVENGSFIVDEEYVRKYREFLKLKEYVDLADKEIKQGAKDFMEATGKTNIVAGGLSFSYRQGTTRISLDSKKLKEELPDVYKKYFKESEVSSSVVVKVIDD